MARKLKPLTSEVYITVDGKPKLWATIDENGNATYYISEKEQVDYSGKMMENAGRVMSDYYSQHPELDP